MARDRSSVGRLERSAISGVLVREVINFSSFWKASVFSSTIDPLVYLLAFGFGFGSLVSTVGGLDYVQFVGTGVVATAVLFSSVFPSMFGSFIKREFQHTYDAILAAPVDAEELMTAEALWIALRASVFGCLPVLVAMVFGLAPSWGMLLVPPIAFVSGFGWSSFGLLVAATFKTIDSFSYVQSTVITPLFLVAGSFFPIDGLPHWAQVAANANPLYHCVQLVRNSVVYGLDWIDLWHAGFLIAFAIVMWRLAIWRSEKRLIV